MKLNIENPLFNYSKSSVNKIQSNKSENISISFILFDEYKNVLIGELVFL